MAYRALTGEVPNEPVSSDDTEDEQEELTSPLPALPPPPSNRCIADSSIPCSALTCCKTGGRPVKTVWCLEHNQVLCQGLTCPSGRQCWKVLPPHVAEAPKKPIVVKDDTNFKAGDEVIRKIRPGMPGKITNITFHFGSIRAIKECWVTFDNKPSLPYQPSELQRITYH